MRRTTVFAVWAGMCSRVAAGLAAFALVALPTTAQAMRVSPMVVEMQTGGTNAVARVQVQNINRTDLPFETKITLLEFDNDGNAVEKPADEDFLVFPPQGLLKGGQRQVVRLQWLGPVELPASRGYYISINQLPVPLAPGEATTAGAAVQIVYHMKALVVVAPPRAAPKVELVSARPVMIAPKAPPAVPGAAAPDPADLAQQPGVEVTVRNVGNRYAMMAGAKWTLKGKGPDGKPLTVVKSPEELNRDVGVGYLAPLTGVRTFQVPTGEPFGPGPIAVEFSN
jgi:fimbrial chaperone protein